MEAIMNRRTFHSLLACTAGLAVDRTLWAQGSTKFQPTWPSLERHQVPEWFQNAKLGIFVHWGLYSVPAWAPPTGELGKVDWNTWFTNNPYAEWYLNTLRIKGSPTYRHHVETYGQNFDYYQFATDFDKGTAGWQPETWAKLFQKTGARYVVLTTKHHDGFRLWPSRVTNPHANGRQISAKRDLVGDLTTAVRSSGMKMGLYYSGGLDWTFTTEPIRNRQELKARVPQSQEYATYADAHWRELIERYQPAVLWNDISYPKLGQTPQIFAQYYNSVPGGVINNRFDVPFADYTTPEYAKYDKITPKKWESCRGLGFSFGYNRVEGPEQVIAPDKLVALLVDIVSKNGNLLLNVGPKPDGTISDIQLDRLHKLGAWLDANGEAIFDTKPWVKPSATGPNGTDVRFTSKNDALYVTYLNGGSGGTLSVPGIKPKGQTTVKILGSNTKATLQTSGNAILVKPDGPIPKTLAVSIKLTPAPEPAT
jgi:alpha-L-fucosidase